MRMFDDVSNLEEEEREGVGKLEIQKNTSLPWLLNGAACGNFVIIISSLVILCRKLSHYCSA